MRSVPLLSRRKHTTTEALVGLYSVVLTASVIAALYFGRALLVPLALAGLLTFVLTPLVSRMERAIGRFAAVTCVTVLVFCTLGAIGWVLARQGLDLANQLPNYRANIVQKLHALDLSKDGTVKRFSEMLVELESEIPVFKTPPKPVLPSPTTKNSPADRPPDVVVVPAKDLPAELHPFTRLQPFLMSSLRFLASFGIVIVLVIFMLLKREDLRGRLIKIIGQGRISSTSRAMEDAAGRVSRYLTMQLVVNVTFGTTVAAGFYLIGLPNAFLWGALAAVLRFIPYVGAPLAGFFPVLLALAVSPGWQLVVLTAALYALLELATGNLLEPLIYRSSTGVSSLALIVAALFWTWLWGPMGLLLSTPITVCLAVLGRHVPKLAFLSVLLGNEEALTPGEECYHRLLVGGLNEAGVVVDTYLNANSLTALYDNVLVPAVTIAEIDYQREDLEEVQRSRVLQGVRDIIDDLHLRPPPKSQIEADKSMAASDAPAVAARVRTDYRVMFVSPRGERDELAGLMLEHLLRQQGFDTAVTSPSLSPAQVAAQLDEFKADACCISVIPPTNLIHARHLCQRIRTHSPKIKIMVGTWGVTENFDEAVKNLRASGADEVVVSLAEAVVQFTKLSAVVAGQPAATAKIPADEEQRIAAVLGLDAYGTKSNPAFDRMTKTLTRTFNVPIAFLTLIDRARQHFKSQAGLPPELSGVCDVPRGESICTHVVAENAALVVEDLQRDRRFSGNPLLQRHGIRFYAGVPLHAPDGQPVGALCILDTKPRKFGEADLRLLKVLGDEMSDQLAPLATASAATKPAVAA